MKSIFLALCFLVSASRAVDTLSIPTDFNSVATGTRANLAGNFSSIQTWAGKVRDSLSPVTARLSGYTGSLTITSLSNLRLKLDGDNSETARLSVESSNGDSLFRISEDSSAKFFGPVTLPSPVITGTIPGTLAATNGTYSGTLGVTGATTISNNLTLSLLSANRVPYTTTGGLVTSASTMTYDGTNLAVNNGTYSGTLGVTGLSTLGRLNVTDSSIALGDGVTKGTLLTLQGKTGFTNPYLFNTTSTAGQLDITVNSGSNRSIGMTNTGAGVMSLVVEGTVTADSLISSKFYTEGTFIGTLTGCTTSPTGAISYVRIGKVVFLKIPTIFGTSNANTMTITGLPASLTPPTDTHLSVGINASCEDNGSITACLLNIVSGVLKYGDPSYTGFTTSGTKGTNDAFGATQTWTYTLQ